MAVLSLVTLSFSAQANSVSSDSKNFADKVIAEYTANKQDRINSRLNPQEYYEGKLSLCLFKQDIENSFNKTKVQIDLKLCSGIVSQALSRGDLSESGVKEVIDLLSKKRGSAEIENAARIEREKQIQLKTNDLIEYANQKLN